MLRLFLLKTIFRKPVQMIGGITISAGNCSFPLFSAGTVRKYTQGVAHFLAWYEREEQVPLTLENLTPIALIGYRNKLQHAKHKSISTINLHVSALRTWCGCMTEQAYLESDPAAHVKLVGQEKASERSGLKSGQVNALLRLAQESREGARNYAIVQVLLQTGCP
jgi:site-specific recombinase XerD